MLKKDLLLKYRLPTNSTIVLVHNIKSNGLMFRKVFVMTKRTVICASWVENSSKDDSSYSWKTSRLGMAKNGILMLFIIVIYKTLISFHFSFFKIHLFPSIPVLSATHFHFCQKYSCYSNEILAVSEENDYVPKTCPEKRGHNRTSCFLLYSVNIPFIISFTLINNFRLASK